MKPVVDAILALIFTITVGIAGVQLYKFVKKEALSKVQEGLLAMEPFAQKLTGQKSTF